MTPQLDQIRRRYEAGDLDYILEDIITFVIQHQQEIRLYRDIKSRLHGKPLGDWCAIARVILDRKSINPRRELGDEIEEVQRERWIRGERGEMLTENEAAELWARFHAAGWRDHRLLVYLYIVSENRTALGALLHAG